MDLDDSFYQDLLRRKQARKEYLTAKKNENPVIFSKKRPVLAEESQILDEEDENLSTEESPKRQRLSLLTEDNEYGKENVEMEDMEEEPLVPYKASSNRGLAALRSKHNSESKDDKSNSGSASSTEGTAPKAYIFSTNSTELCSDRKTRLANLAANINQWEDESHSTDSLTSLKNPSTYSKNFFSSTASCSFGPKSPVSKPDSSYFNTTEIELNNSDSKSTNTFGEFSGNSSHSILKANDFESESSLSNTFPSNSNDSVTEASTDSKCTYMFGDFSGNKTKIVSPCLATPNEKRAEGESAKIATRINVWEQAVKAALESETNIKSPIKTLANIPGNGILERESSAKSCDEERKVITDSFGPKKGNRINKHLNGNLMKNEDLDKSFEPADLPLSARKALFEKALIGGNTRSPPPPEKLSVAQKAAMFETATKTNTKPKPAFNLVESKPSSFPTSPVKSTKAPQSYPSPSKSAVPKFQAITNQPLQTIVSPCKAAQSQKTFDYPQFVKKSTSSQLEKTTSETVQHKKEISNLVSHWEKLSSTPSVGNAHADEIKHSKPEIHEETYASEEDADYVDEKVDCRSDMGSELYEKESKADWREQEETHEYDATLSEQKDEACQNDESQSDEDMWDAEKEVFNPKVFSAQAGLANFDVDTDYSTDDTRSHYGRQCSNTNSVSSESISAKSSSYESNTYSASKSQGSSSGGSLTSSNRESEAGEEVFLRPPSPASDPALCHTVSFYRRQKQMTRTPPMQTIVRREPIAEEPQKEDTAEVIQERIQLLQEEILRQQTVIGQTSQALNLCHASAEFSESAEQVEGEKILLIATQKRQACLNEIQRLKLHGSQGQSIADGSGTLTITDMQLPLKRDFIAGQLEGKLQDTVHYFLCLIRHGAQVIVTQMVSTNDKISSDGALCFTNHIKLQNLPSDFSVVFEVYTLQTKKEVLPHNKKYHIKKESKVHLTPKGKKSESKLLFPGISSPGGPHAVRSPSFAVIGFTRFIIQNCDKKCFTLDKVPFSSPLEGVLRVRLHLHVEHQVAERGFLTMFEDVSGFGGWHRRWCRLSARHLSYWKYPDQEAKREPMGAIDLRQCVTPHVKLLSRDICARPHTFQLVTMRAPEKGDKNTLVSRCMDTVTSTRYLLSADTKEERVVWCDKLNEALANLRQWDSKALRPIEEKQE